MSRGNAGEHRRVTKGELKLLGEIQNKNFSIVYPDAPVLTLRRATPDSGWTFLAIKDSNRDNV